MSLEEVIRELIGRSGGIKAFAELAGVSRQTLYRILSGEENYSPYICTIKDIGIKTGYDLHRLAHHAFDLPPPEQLGELSGDLKRLCEIVMSLTEEERQRLLDKIEGWIEGIREAEGGGAADKDADARAGFG